MLTTLRNASHLVTIAWTLARHDALFILEEMGIYPTVTWLCKRVARRSVDARPGKRLAAALQALGPTFIKAGQALSTRSDLVGEAIAQDLTHLQDQLPPFDSALAKQRIEDELGDSIENLFDHFDEDAVAAASIAQVHFAKTKEGKEVAVKVLRPNVEAQFARDIAMLMWLATLAEAKRPDWRKKFKPVAVVETFAATINIELDMRFEAAAAEELRFNSRNDSYFYVPEVDWQRTSGRVLTTERIRGFHASDAEGMLKAGIDITKVTEHAANAFFNQVFRDGFFHADMHPGNLFVLPDGRLAPVDFGIMGRIDRESQIYLAEILYGFLKEDYMHVARVHRDAGYIPQHIDLGQFAQACMAVGKPILDKPLNEISVGQLLGQLIHIAETFEMEVQPHLLLLQKTMVTAEGVGRGLNPTVNMWKLSEPLIMGWAKENLSPKARLKYYSQDTIDVLRQLPRVLNDAKTLMDTVRDQGFTLSPDTVARIHAQRASQHRAWLRLGWAALILLGALLFSDLYLILE
jgi:ubiquinone biosynthesis protein